MQRADGGVASGLLLFASTPQSIRLAAYCQLPGRGAFLVRFTSLQIKPALKGEVDASVTSRRRGCIEVALVYANPSVSYADSSPSGEPFGYRPPECARPISRKLSLICLN